MAKTLPTTAFGVLFQATRRSASFLWLVLLAGYLSLIAGQAVYSTYQAQNQSAALQTKLAEVRLQRQRVEALLVYYGTDSFKEKELRRSLLLQKTGEKVYALPESSVATTAEQEVQQEFTTASAAHPILNLPVWRQWLEYVQGHKG